MSTYDLSTRYDSRQSFYGKARVEQDDDDSAMRLLSYGTHVATIYGHGERAEVYGLYSATTTRHIKEFLKQNGFKVETAKQVMKDYGV